MCRPPRRPDAAPPGLGDHDVAGVEPHEAAGGTHVPGQVQQIVAWTAADVQNRSAAIAVKVHEPEQMVELLEMVLIQVVEKPARSDRMPRDLEVVNVPVPIGPDVGRRCHECRF